jgi:hypothetical protein
MEQNGFWSVLTAPPSEYTGRFWKRDESHTDSTIPLCGLLYCPMMTAAQFIGRDPIFGYNEFAGAGYWFRALTAEEQSTCAIDGWLCPSSHSGNDSICIQLDEDAGTGPRSDYKFVASRNDTDNFTRWWMEVTAWADYPASVGRGNTKNQAGPFLAPTVTLIPGVADAGINDNTGFGNNTGFYTGNTGSRDDIRSVHCLAVDTWTPSKDISWWSDGSSNQICMGEKHIPSWAQNGRKAPAPVARDDTGVWWDGGCLTTDASGSRWHNTVGSLLYNPGFEGPGDPQIFPTHIASSPKIWETAVVVSGTETQQAALNTPGNGIWRNSLTSTEGERFQFYPSKCNSADRGASFGFGSSHSGVVNFLIGDGTVHAFDKSTSPYITYCLGNVSDGNPVAIP